MDGPFTYGSVCSGIEAATVAWDSLGWKPVFYSEIEAFPRAVLSNHYPEVPLHGDFTTIGADKYGSINLLVGGTPCQSFSVAGLRGGMDDDRGNLALEYLKLAQRKRPTWLVWENVPGVLSSSGGRDFGSFLGGLVKIGYGFAYRVLDAQYFGVAQRRRRVFVIGYLGDWRPAAAVLFERQSLQGHPAPSREARQDPARTITSGLGRRRGSGQEPGSLVSSSHWDGSECHPTLNQSNTAGGIGMSNQELFSQKGGGLIPTAFGGNNTSGPIKVATAVKGNNSNYDFESETFIAFSCKDNGRDATKNLSPTLRAMGGKKPNGGGQVAVAFAQNSRDEVRYQGGDGQISGALSADPGMKQTTYLAIGTAFAHGVDYENNAFGPLAPCGPLMAGSRSGGGRPLPAIQKLDNTVRRLTPIECERLQGFPDGYTQIAWKGKRPEECPDGHRYKALGNSMAVPVMHWIGKRIKMVDGLINK
jgi:DNA (cytosine-5)-methyltransferase 1